MHSMNWLTIAMMQWLMDASKDCQYSLPMIPEEGDSEKRSFIMCSPLHAVLL